MPNTLNDYADELLECFRIRLEAWGNPAKDVAIRAGDEIAWDQCDSKSCGQAWVRLLQLGPSDSFPLPAEQQNDCFRGQFVATYELGVLRCWPTVTNSGAPGDPVKRTAVTHTVHDDAVAMLEAAQCCWADLHPDEDWQIGLWQPVGPGGGCVGGTLQVQLQYEFCCPDADA